jgi:pimeloyl-ACP methyl ester carboxylesterase
MPLIERNGVHVYYEIFGHGPPLVLLHSLSTNRYVWANQLFAFARDHRVLVVDHRGHGLSDAPATGYAIAEMAADLVAVLDHAAVDRAVLVGSSAGGMIAVQAALDAPARVRAMMLVSCATNLAPAIPPEVLRAYEARFEQAFDYMIGGAISARTKRDRPEVGAFLADVYRVKGSFSREVFLECIRDPAGVFNWNVAERLNEIRLPALVISGQEDRAVPIEATAFLARELHAEHRVVPDVGHHYQLESPADFNADLRAFLNRAGA